MNYITRTKGIIDNGTLISRQETTVQIAKTLGIEPISFYYLTDSESDERLFTRLDGILSCFSYGDNLILQMPTFLNVGYVLKLIDKINMFRRVSSTKLIMYVHNDLVLNYSIIPRNPLVRILNQADALIVSNPATAKYLCQQGVKVKRFFYFYIYDYLLDEPCEDNKDIKRYFNMIGTQAELFNKLKKFTAPIHVYDSAVVNIKNITWHKVQINDQILPYYLNYNGGIGIVWPSFSEKIPVVSDTLGLFIAAKMPMIAKFGSREADLVTKYQFGYVADSLDDAVDWVKSFSSNEYYQLQEHIQVPSEMVRSGFFTKKALENTLYNLMRDENAY